MNFTKKIQVLNDFCPSQFSLKKLLRFQRSHASSFFLNWLKMNPIFTCLYLIFLYRHNFNKCDRALQFYLWSGKIWYSSNFKLGNEEEFVNNYTMYYSSIFGTAINYFYILKKCLEYHAILIFVVGDFKFTFKPFLLLFASVFIFPNVN